MFPPHLQNQLRSTLKGELLFNEPLARYTSVKIGGPADILFYPQDLEDLKNALVFCHEKDLSHFVIGNGSNLLVRDGGVRGLVVRLNRILNTYKTEENPEDDITVILSTDAGVMLPKLVELSKQNGWSGLESLYGVPGTVGGALLMNAGTREGEIGDSVLEITALENNGRIKTYSKKRLHFEYRDLKIPRSEIILSAKLLLKKSDPKTVMEKVEFFQKRRHQTQPLDQPSMGSVFKNPSKKFAAQLIEELGLKGVRVGGARVSEKHSNWIVNEGGATAQDILILIGLVRDKVKEVTGIRLETEVKVVGEDKNPE